jgi:hypothetical protein
MFSFVDIYYKIDAFGPLFEEKEAVNACIFGIDDDY